MYVRWKTKKDKENFVYFQHRFFLDSSPIKSSPSHTSLLDVLECFLVDFTSLAFGFTFLYVFFNF